jgi:pyrroloquinoline quinone (PQQ) biosynthesis protein C
MTALETSFMSTPNAISPPMSWIQALEHEARALLEQLDTHPASRQLFDGSIRTESYVHYLIRTYQYARWTTPLLAEAGHRMKHLGQHPELGELLLRKAAEEHGHERWLLADLKNLGWPAERAGRMSPGFAVSAYIAWNRFTSGADRPVAFLGTAYVLEYLSVYRASQSVERLLAAQRIPNIHKAVTFLRAHGSADSGHVAELTALLTPLKAPEEQAAVLLSAQTTRTLYMGLFTEGPEEPRAHAH